MESLQQSSHLSTGARGERIAADYLCAAGYLILEQNWYFRHRELDIIALYGGELVVVEVKTRTDPLMDDPAQLVNRKKQRLIVSAAHAYIRYHRLDLDVRFDLIIIRIDRMGDYRIEHIESAFIPLL